MEALCHSDLGRWLRACNPGTRLCIHILALTSVSLSNLLKISVFQFPYLLDEIIMLLPGGSDGKEPACNMGDMGSTPGLGRSPGEENHNPLQYSCLEKNPMNRGAWQAKVHGATKSRHDWATNFLFLLSPFVIWSSNHYWQVMSTFLLLLPLFLPVIPLKVW